MRKPSVFTSRRSELDIKMTPMIDVVFLLLIFFVWTASFQVVEHILPSSVSAVTGTSPIDPNQPVPEIEDFEDVVVRVVSENGRVVWRVNDQPVANLSDLKRQLQTIASIKKDAPVILHPDPGVSLGDVIDVYDLSRLVGFEKVQFAASESI
ncbi:MAG: biopolymer transport protein ExbD [Pirellulaceae bacterium]|jgi:biopolymer transport protein ExbD